MATRWHVCAIGETHSGHYYYRARPAWKSGCGIRAGV